MKCPDLKELPPPPSGRTGWPWAEQSETLAATMPDGAEWPRLTIITPSYNQGKFLEETIRSVLLQGYPNLEYLIIDGASADNSLEIIKKYEPWLTYWESQKDEGQCHAINKGWRRAQPGIWAWINSDDIYNPGTFFKAVSALKNGAQAPLVHATVDFVDEESRVVENMKYNTYPLPEGIEKMKFWINWPIPQPTIFFDSELVQKYGFLDQRFHYSLDYEWLIRVSRHERFQYIDDNWATYRIHADSKTGDWNVNKEKFFCECRKANWKNAGLLDNIRLWLGERLHKK